MTTSTYPVRVDAVLDTHLNRGLWLIKWAAVLPHYLILAFLWLSFVVLSLVALVAILATGKYPRTIFDFNVGVLRWSWRVAYYAYGALGTDHYPPFTLRDVPDYPARLDVDYPEHLSRGLALVKWWLLAIPHYAVVAIFLGGGAYVANEVVSSQDATWIWGGGLIGLLVLVAAVVLLFTGRYPREVFDLVLGMNRWVLRVAAYAGLMTDQYPPFRLDQGGTDPGSAQRVTTEPPLHGTSPPASVTGEGAAHWSTGRIIAVVAGSVLLLASGGLIASGIAAAVADQGMRDEAGFITSDPETFTTPTYALTTQNLEFHVADGATWVPASLLGDARITATAPAGSEVFIGIAPTAQVQGYLADVPHSVLVDRTDGEPTYRTTTGVAEPTAPADLDLWTVSATGPGEQPLTWAPQDGDWTIVLMNADATRAVTADVTVGGELPALGAAVAVLLAVGGTLLVLSVVVITLALRRRSAASPTANSTGGTPETKGARS